ncbi:MULTISPECIES: Tic20 family protein [Cylindrospermopsis]|jgi:uncharacterized membrane protein|uniref:Tic20 family protein n=1 Tax=Cylindrospermopsis TaxID=77021 RepID=UPI00070E90D6|nr:MULTISPECIES: Tic20 family protein [Cylindrospermopsis]KRH97161.1 hypothetical protein ASL19_05565 [Cylindrospermopsis sp. CR12]MBU6345709.1 hypothetical protein [Cyanobacteria bacterium REEB494]TPX27443.1 hypothetical protein FIV49_14620 [Cylindrospermopsis raciborskii GIHE 2018]UJL33879.1 hypothetical protein C6N34_001040 [Cylindrospermopsis raciborskii Cr2010]
MSWRGSTTIPDRIFACLPYLLPLVDSLAFSGFLVQQFPILGIVLLPILPIATVYQASGYGQILVFFALFFFVVRNEKINHFIRFNAMQAILLDIIIFLSSILLRVFGTLPSSDFAVQILENTIFLGIFACVVYSVFQSLNGRYPEIPAISEAVHIQVR